MNFLIKLLRNDRLLASIFGALVTICIEAVRHSIVKDDLPLRRDGDGFDPFDDFDL